MNANRAVLQNKFRSKTIIFRVLKVIYIVIYGGRVLLLTANVRQTLQEESAAFAIRKKLKLSSACGDYGNKKRERGYSDV
jgi:hypothetical protein